MTVDKLTINEFQDLAKLFSKNKMNLSYGSGFLELHYEAKSQEEATKKIENMLRTINVSKHYEFVLDFQRVDEITNSDSKEKMFQAKLYAQRNVKNGR